MKKDQAPKDRHWEYYLPTDCLGECAKNPAQCLQLKRLLLLNEDNLLNFARGEYMHRMSNIGREREEPHQVVHPLRVAS